jgi:hypothetical protein
LADTLFPSKELARTDKDDGAIRAVVVSVFKKIRRELGIYVIT